MVPLVRTLTSVGHPGHVSPFALNPKHGLLVAGMMLLSLLAQGQHIGQTPDQNRALADVSDRYINHPNNLARTVANVNQGVLSWYDYDGNNSPDLLITGLRANGNRDGNLYANFIPSGTEFTAHSEKFATPLPLVINGAADWGDYNNDSWPDLMIIGEDSHGPVSKLFHNIGGPGGSNQGFNDRSNLLPNLPGLSHGSVAFGDYDNDSNIDLVVTGKDANGTPVTRLYHNRGGSLGFTEDHDRSQNLPALAYSKAAWADYDGDKRLDLMLTGKKADGTVASGLYHNTGNGFENRSYFLTNPIDVSDGSLTWVDYNKDGNPDLLLTGDKGSDYVTKLYQNLGGNQGFNVKDYQLPDLPGLAGGTASFGDYDHDGLPDLIITGRTKTSQWITRIYHNTGDGFELSPLSSNLVQMNVAAATWVDFDQDGWLDVSMTGTTASGPATKLYRNIASPGQFPGLSDFPGMTYGTVNWVDYDNDGKLDLMLTGAIEFDTKRISKLYHNTGNGFEDKTSSLFQDLPGLSYSAVAWGDYDNDGWLDLMITGSQDGTANRCFSALYRNTGNGFERQNNLLPNLLPVWNGSLAWSDYDNDGKLDLLLTGQAQDKSLVSKLYRNTGSGFDDQTNQLPGLEGMWFTQAAFGDYDNDGRPDLFIAGLTKFAFVSTLYHNTGSGFKAENSRLPGLPQLSAGTVAWGDYDGDGWLDLFVSGEQETEDPRAPRYINKLYHNTGNGFEDKTGLVPFPARASGSAAWGDFDNDGKLDLMTVGSDIGSPSGFYHNTGNGFERGASPLPPELWGGSAAFGDYDNDGRLDVMFTGGSVVAVGQLYHNTTTIANTPPTAPTGLSSQVLSGGTSVKLSWQAATDAQTPSAGLTYNLYVSDTPSSQNVLGPMTDQKSGYRRVVQLGNSQPTSYTLTGLTAGKTYYWSVQAIDGAFAGSPFSPEQSFTTSQLGDPEQALKLVAPLYNCQTGAFTFQTTGGDGTRIEYNAPGITSWTINPRQYVDTGLRTAADAQPITLVARQSGKEVRYVFDLRTICPVGDPNQFRLVAPLYDCETGAFSFRTQGGDDSRIEYMAAGITSWTDDPFQVLDDGLRTSADVKPLELRARQNGNEVRYVWDIRAICPVGEPGPGLGLGSPQSQNFEDVSSLLSDLPAVQAPSVAWGDFDNDGRLDFFLTGKASTPISKLYRNTGGGFEDQSSLLPGLPQVSSSSVAWADYNNDGWPDLLVTSMNANNTPVTRLYRNTGGGFANQTSLIPDQPQVGNGAVAWGDYDNDGRVDFILTGRSASGVVSKLYRNTGSGFEDKTSLIPGLPAVQLSAVAFGDYNNDGKLDLMLTGNIQGNTNPYVSKLYQNTGSGFEDVSSDQLPELVGLAAGTVAWNDFDNDGRLDLLLTGTNGGTRYTTRLYRNTDYGFEDASHFPGIYLGSAAWGDYDNDGLNDLMITGVTTAGIGSKLYRNTGHGFADASDQIPSLPQMAFSSVSWADYDNDGKLDLLMTGYTSSGTVLKLYHNISPVANTPPTSPGELLSRTSTSAVQLVWDLSTDGQTPRAGLNYNVYISDTPGGINTLSPMANISTGYRRVVGLGNSQTPTITIKGLQPNKTYYWSVQAIDGAFAGSPFAAEQSFTTLSSQARVGVGQEPGVGLRAEVYPNPVESELTVQIDGVQDQSVNLQLMSSTGQPVQARKLNVIQPTHQERLPVADLPSGLYLLRVSTDRQNVTLKVIKR